MCVCKGGGGVGGGFSKSANVKITLINNIKLDGYTFRGCIVLCCCFTSTVNIYGHVGIDS